MSRAEDEALKAYPPKMEYSSMIGVALNKKEDANIKLRDAFIKGYEQAISDISMLVIGETMKQGVDIYRLPSKFDISGIVNTVNKNCKNLSEENKHIYGNTQK